MSIFLLRLENRSLLITLVGHFPDGFSVLAVTNSASCLTSKDERGLSCLSWVYSKLRKTESNKSEAPTNIQDLLQTCYFFFKELVYPHLLTCMNGSHLNWYKIRLSTPFKPYCIVFTKTKELSKDAKGKIVNLNKSGMTQFRISKQLSERRSTDREIIWKWKKYKITTINLHHARSHLVGNKSY